MQHVIENGAVIIQVLGRHRRWSTGAVMPISVLPMFSFFASEPCTADTADHQAANGRIGMRYILFQRENVLSELPLWAASQINTSQHA